jgi:sugar O-acyltransferase (sialic acid O-acetyltransferase NeuD family)
MSGRICLFGAGGHGRVVAAQVKRLWPDSELIFADSKATADSSYRGIPVISTEIEAVPADCSLICTIGDNAVRARMQARAAESHTFISFIADPGNFFCEPPGPGSMILAGSVVTTDTTIGCGVIVNSSAIVEHDCEVGDFCHLAPGSVVAGGCRLGSQVFLGANATVLPGLSVAAGTVIGAGSVVTRNITDPGQYAGVPARPLPR